MRASTHDNLTEAAAARVPAETVRNAARALPPDLRIVLYLTDVEGLSYQQAARVMDTTAGAVSQRLRAAHGWMRACLRPAIMAARHRAAPSNQAKPG